MNKTIEMQYRYTFRCYCRPETECIVGKSYCETYSKVERLPFCFGYEFLQQVSDLYGSHGVKKVCNLAFLVRAIPVGNNR